MSRIKAELIRGSGALLSSPSLRRTWLSRSPPREGWAGLWAVEPRSGFSAFHLPSAASSQDEPTSLPSPSGPVAEVGGVLAGLHQPGSIAGCDTGDTELIGISLLGEASLNAVFSDHYLADGESWELKSKGSCAQCLRTREEKMLDRARLIANFAPQQLFLISLLWGEVLYSSWGARCSQAAS